MQSTKREMHVTQLLAQLATVIALGVFYAIIGPFGTYTDLTTPARYAYWVGTVAVGYAAILVVAHAVAALWPGLGQVRALAAVTRASSVPTSFVVAWAESVLRLSKPVPLSVMPRVFLCVAAIQCVTLLFLTRFQPSWAPLLFTRQAAVPHEPAGPQPAQSAPVQLPPPFFERIPPHLGRQLLALGAEDHYLRVMTAQGSDLILMRMADAIRELGDGTGLQVHRSWWVALDAVTEVRRDGARTALVLANGQEVPVSRTFAAAVRAQQWPNLGAASAA
jgi:DNA-binding LytR/AlgR family response regulator